MTNEEFNQTVNDGQVKVESAVVNDTPTPAKVKATRDLIWKIICLAVFLAMVTVNALASILPINGQNTGEISDSYPNLFAPAGITFAIWGVIYVLLAAFIVFQFFETKTGESEKRLKWTRIFFLLSSLANIAWIFCWHYHQILASLLVMLVILVCLAVIHVILTKVKMKTGEYLFLRLPFSIYFGWITVATVANVTTWLVSIGWDGSPIMSEGMWTVTILVVAAVIALAVVTSRGSWAYGATVVWAYAGILIKHLDPGAFASEYIAIIITVSICLGLLAAASLLAVFGRKIKLTT